MPPEIDIDHDKLTAFCRRHHIRRLWLFGSVLRDDFKDDSDVDVLVEFEPGHEPGLAFIDIQNSLSRHLAGHPVDLVLEEDLNPLIREHPYFNSEIVYAEG